MIIVHEMNVILSLLQTTALLRKGIEMDWQDIYYSDNTNPAQKFKSFKTVR